jgi:membrane protein YqaA with SNARE-associated domain
VIVHLSFQELINSLWQVFAPYRYFGVFAVSFIGTASIIVPVPYTILILNLSMSSTEWDPFLLTIAGGVGSALGEMLGYVLGYFGRVVINEERQRKMVYLVKIFDHYGPLAIFVFALTPLPDDLLYIPLGIMRYKFFKAFIPTLLGKLLMIFIIVYFGRTAGDLILLLFGDSGSTIAIVVSMVLLFVILFAMYRIDWEKVFEKYVVKRSARED